MLNKRKIFIVTERRADFSRFKPILELIKKDIKNLIQQIINDISKEKINKRIIMILKLIRSI